MHEAECNVGYVCSQEKHRYDDLSLWDNGIDDRAHWDRTEDDSILYVMGGAISIEWKSPLL